MATGVFGAPITLDTLRATATFPEPITQKACADYAMKMISAGEKDLNAVKYVENLKAKYGKGVSTRCLIYNGTGTTLEFKKSMDFHGKVYENPYPSTIMNGQWGGFLHIHPSYGMGFGSAGAVVYRSIRPDNSMQYCDWAYSWLDPYLFGSNRVCTLIRDTDHFSEDDSYWHRFYSLLENSKSSSEDENYGYWSKVMIGQGTSVEVRGTLTMK